jgi:TolB protein
VTTTGGKLDPDGYLVTLDGRRSLPAPTNGVVTFNHVVPGEHVLVASGAEFNCTFADDSIDVSVQAGETTTAQLTATCRRYFDNDIVFSTEEFGPGEIMVMRPDGTGRERITIHPSFDGQAAPSPDGLQIVFVSTRDGVPPSLYVMTADATDVRKLAERAGEPSWSPDGDWIAFRVTKDGPFGQFARIFVIGVDGVGLRQVSDDTPHYTSDDNPSWSPDGTRILFTRSGELFTVAPDGSALTQVGACPGPCDEPRWSPDGTEIAFSMSFGGSIDIHRMNADGSSVFRVTTDPAQENYPTWSPDGSQLAFARVVDGLFQIFRVSRDGGTAVKLSTVAAHDFSPFWSRAR